MNSSVIGRVIVGWIPVILLVAAGMAAGAGTENGQAPGAEPQFRAGDSPAIAAQYANLTVGTNVVAKLPKGQRIVVVEVRQPWVGTYVSIDGQQKGGWIKIADFIPSGPVVEPGALIHTAARVVTSEPIESADNRPAISITVRPQYNYYSSDRENPIYEHGIERDIHQWEPWRHR